LKQKRINKAMDRKEKSIAWHNSSNVAAELIKSYPFSSKKTKKKKFQKVFTELRDLVYAEWQNWYLENVFEIEKTKPVKLTGKDFAIAKKEAPARQAEQELAEAEGQKQRIEDDKEREANITFDLVNQGN